MLMVTSLSRLWQGREVHIMADQKQRGKEYRKRPVQDKVLEDMPPVPYWLHPGSNSCILPPPIMHHIVNSSGNELVMCSESL